MVTIKDVAKSAGVSPATVSLVLNQRSTNVPISDATKKKVLNAAKILGYQPNTFAKSLRTNRSFVIGIMAFDIVDPYCVSVLRGAEEIIHENHYYPILFDLHNDDRDLEGYLSLIKERRVEGLLILASAIQLKDRLVKKLQHDKIPVVIIGREMASKDVPTVVVDNQGGAYLATEHLLTLGHRQLSFILGPSQYIDSEQRWEGCRSALEQYGVPIEKDLVVSESEVGWGPTAGYDSMKELLARNKTITGVIAFDDISAFGAIRAITEVGMRVPDDISVVGFDDLTVSAFYNPPLTTVRYDMVEMGRIGATTLIDLTSGSTSSGDRSGSPQPTELVVRQSTASVR